MRVPAGGCVGVPAEVRAEVRVGMPAGMCAGMPLWRRGWLRRCFGVPVWRRGWLRVPAGRCFGVPAGMCAGSPAGMCAWRRGLWGKGLANQIKSVHI
ncbi:hypothetical protein, partial [Bartonella sp. CL32QHWL-1]|uniref:hypothetical protein n=1 Tax=Bartonella sp. CL32QHWL-1 TaxID=3243524 RepID=UPI0035D10817